LPPADLLRLHVTEDFLEQMREGQLEVAAMEALAEAFHERWCKQRRRQGWTYNPIRNDTKKEHPLLVPYAKLSEADKERNRLPARLTQAKLLDVGYRIERLDGASHIGATMRRFGKAVFARLMEIEHDIWLRDHLLAGYEWAEESKDHLRLHRDIMPFKNVPAVDKKLDRGNIVILPYVLRKFGYTLVRD